MGELGVVLGDKYIIAGSNIAPEMGWVKSMWVKILHVVLRDDATVTWDDSVKSHVVPATQVRAIIIKLEIGPLKKKVFYPGLPAGVLALPMTTRKLTTRIAGGRLAIRTVQSVLVHASSVTGHKIQGLTLDFVCIINFLHSGICTPKWLYVALSREPWKVCIWRNQSQKILIGGTPPTMTLSTRN